MAREHPFLLAGEWQRSGQPLEVRSPYNGEVVGVTFVPSAEQVEAAIERGGGGFEQTRRPARALAEGRAGAGMPPGMVSVLPVPASLAEEKLVKDDRFKMLTFTGSAEVGWRLKGIAGKKRVTLELGGNAAVIIDEDADTELAVKRIAQGGYTYAGQSCISVQRVSAHESAYAAVSRELVAAVQALKVGDPMDPETDVGPMIEEAAAQRTREWVEDAVAEGAKLLTGGDADGPFFQPTVLENVPPASKVCRGEVFAPIVALFPFGDFSEAVAAVNDSPYGLQAGVF